MAESGTNMLRLEKVGSQRLFAEEMTLCEWLSQELSQLLLDNVSHKTSELLTQHISVSILSLASYTSFCQPCRCGLSLAPEGHQGCVTEQGTDEKENF